MRELKQLVVVLERELRFQEELLSILASERAAIVHLNDEDLKQIAQAKTQLFERAATVGLDRSRLIQDIAGEQGRLPECIAVCSDESVRSQLHQMRDKLKQVTLRVLEMNKYNGELLKQSLGMVASTISILKGGATAKPVTYSAKGTQENAGALGLTTSKTGSVRREA
ncbi:MAG: flagellar protein FlgN [bacterium]|nr:flagellar protein FlgN [bacterium]